LLAWCDAVFIVRPKRRWSVVIARLARALRRHVIVYWDDNPFTFPRTHPDKPTWFEPPQVRRAMTDVIETAHLLAVANPRVVAAFRAHGLRVAQSVVLAVPALGVDLTAPPPAIPAHAPPTIGYAGHHWYAPILEQTIAPALAQLRGEGVAFRWEIAGPNPTLPPELAPVTSHFETMGYTDWITFRNAHPWDLGLAVVPDGPHFACKFYNKFVEYTAAGVPAIYSKAPPYTDAVAHGVNGWLTENTVAAWADAIRTLLADPALRLRLRDVAWAKLAAEHSMDAVVASYRAGLRQALIPRPNAWWRR
jgi:hypothetical protein